MTTTAPPFSLHGTYYQAWNVPRSVLDVTEYFASWYHYTLSIRGAERSEDTTVGLGETIRVPLVTDMGHRIPFFFFLPSLLALKVLGFFFVSVH